MKFRILNPKWDSGLNPPGPWIKFRILNKIQDPQPGSWMKFRILNPEMKFKILNPEWIQILNPEWNSRFRTNPASWITKKSD
jgi:hypothetical protein